jgi:hypothetical protein
LRVDCYGGFEGAEAEVAGVASGVRDYGDEDGDGAAENVDEGLGDY